MMRLCVDMPKMTQEKLHDPCSEDNGYTGVNVVFRLRETCLDSHICEFYALG